MIKKRKDAGFTLVELMIVIAVVGILAVVLIPNVGSTKNSPKEVGLETNLKTVQGYVESKITQWVSSNTTGDAVEAAIVAEFTTNKLTNPITAMSAVPVTTLANRPSLYVTDTAPTTTTPALSAANSAGTVVVVVAGTTATVTSITITAYGVQGTNVVGAPITITP